MATSSDSAQPASAPSSTASSGEARVSISLPRTAEGYKRLPTQVIAIGASKAQRSFSVSVRPDGSLGVREKSKTKDKQPVILTIAPELLFHRQGRFVPRDQRSLQAVCRDLFPFDSDETRYAVRLDLEGRPVFYALVEGVFQTLLERLSVTDTQVQAILISEPTAKDIKASILERLQTGPVADLALPARNLIQPSLMILGALVVLMLVGLLSFSTITTSVQEAKLAEAQSLLGDLESRFGETAQQYEDIQLMQESLQVYADFSDPLYRRSFEAMFTLINSVPRGDLVQSVEFELGTVVLSGLSNDTDTWFRAAGLTPVNVEVTDLPSQDAFKATFDIR